MSAFRLICQRYTIPLRLQHGNRFIQHMKPLLLLNQSRLSFCHQTQTDSKQSKDEQTENTDTNESKSKSKSKSFIRDWILPIGAAIVTYELYSAWNKNKTHEKYRNIYKDFFVFQGLSIIQKNHSIMDMMGCDGPLIHIINQENSKWTNDGDLNYFTFEISNNDSTKTAEVAMILTVYAFDDDKHLKIKVNNIIAFDKLLTTNDLDKNVSEFMKQYFPKDPAVLDIWHDHCGLELAPTKKLNDLNFNDKIFTRQLKTDVINMCNKNADFVKIFGEINDDVLKKSNAGHYYDAFNEVNKSRFDLSIINNTLGIVRVETIVNDKAVTELKVVALGVGGECISIFRGVHQI